MVNFTVDIYLKKIPSESTGAYNSSTFSRTAWAVLQCFCKLVEDTRPQWARSNHHKSPRSSWLWWMTAYSEIYNSVCKYHFLQDELRDNCLIDMRSFHMVRSSFLFCFVLDSQKACWIQLMVSSTSPKRCYWIIPHLKNLLGHNSMLFSLRLIILLNIF